MSDLSCLDEVVKISNDFIEEVKQFYKDISRKALKKGVYCSPQTPLPLLVEILEEKNSLIELNNSCYYCGSSKLQKNNHDFLVCKDCYSEQPEKPYTQDERLMFDREQVKKRKTHETSFLKGTVICHSNKGIINRPKFYRLRKWQHRSQTFSWKERNKAEAFNLINKACTNLSLPKHARNFAENIYLGCIKENVIKGRSISSMAAASLLVSLNKFKIIRREKDLLANFLKASKKALHHSYSNIVRNIIPVMGVEYKPNNSIILHTCYLSEQLNNPEIQLGNLMKYLKDLSINYMESVINKFSASNKGRLGMLEKIISKEFDKDTAALYNGFISDLIIPDCDVKELRNITFYYISMMSEEDLLQQLIKRFQGRSNFAVAASLLYNFSKEGNISITQKNISELADITEVSVRNNCRFLNEKFGVKSVELKEFDKTYKSSEIRRVIDYIINKNFNYREVKVKKRFIQSFYDLIKPLLSDDSLNTNEISESLKEDLILDSNNDLYHSCSCALNYLFTKGFVNRELVKGQYYYSLKTDNFSEIDVNNCENVRELVVNNIHMINDKGVKVKEFAEALIKNSSLNILPDSFEATVNKTLRDLSEEGVIDRKWCKHAFIYYPKALNTPG
ncbi:MAG: hypothetical protein JW791_01620 [Nanoarchaeota archaeon]|nr:hypothetical protein [Nanoarchaeota archaeon]